MRKISFLITIVLCFCLIAGCSLNSKQTMDTTSSGQSENVALDIESPNFESYKGDWLLKASEDEELFLITELLPYHGSTNICIEEIESDHAKGSITSISAASSSPLQHIAHTSFEGDIVDGTLKASYKDDGWLSSGDIELIFGTDEIKANITRDEPISDMMWGIPEGQLTFLRSIDTETVTMSDDESAQFHQLFSIISKDKIEPFKEGELTDEQIIRVIGLNIALGWIDISKFDDNSESVIEDAFAGYIVDKSVMNNLSIIYFGTGIQEHKSIDPLTYNNGSYTIPALGGVSEYPVIRMLLKDSGNEGIYYAVVDYMFDIPEEETEFEYQYLIKLQKNDSYVIESIDEVNMPMDFEFTDSSGSENGEKSYEDIGFELLLSDSIGPLKMNVSEKEVINIIEDTKEKGEFELWGADGREHQTWNYDSKGIQLDMVRDENDQTMIMVDMIRINSNCEFKTARNVGIGSTYEEVLDAYKEEVDPEKAETNKSELVAGSAYGGIIFTFENDKVVSMFFGAASE